MKDRRSGGSPTPTLLRDDLIGFDGGGKVF